MPEGKRLRVSLFDSLKSNIGRVVNRCSPFSLKTEKAEDGKCRGRIKSVILVATMSGGNGTL